MNYIELANFIRDNYTPFAFKCSCNGEHPDCARTIREDVYAIAQYDTVIRIANAISGMESL